MYIHNRKRLIGALKKEGRDVRWGLGTGYVTLFIKGALEDLDGCLKNENGRDNFEAITGIRVKKIGPFIF